jgi:hypothetical protein
MATPCLHLLFLGTTKLPSMCQIACSYRHGIMCTFASPAPLHRLSAAMTQWSPQCSTVVLLSALFEGVFENRAINAIQVYGVTWNPHILERKCFVFVTWGKKHCKLWVQQRPSAAGNRRSVPAWVPSLLSFGRFDLQNVNSAAFLPKSHALALGLNGGEVLVVEGGQAVRSIVAHRPGPQLIVADGSRAYSGVRGMALHKDNSVLLTAGMLLFQYWFPYTLDKIALYFDHHEARATE